MDSYDSSNDIISDSFDNTEIISDGYNDIAIIDDIETA